MIPIPKKPVVLVPDEAIRTTVSDGNGPSAIPMALRPAIEKALQRRARKEVRDLRVTIQNGCVTIAGTVYSPGEKRAILAAVRATHGVRTVTDELVVDPGL